MIADAEATENAAQWQEFLMHVVLECGSEGFRVAVGSAYCVTFVPVGRRFAVNETGQTDWTSVTRLKLTGINRQG